MAEVKTVAAKAPDFYRWSEDQLREAYGDTFVVLIKAGNTYTGYLTPVEVAVRPPFNFHLRLQKFKDIASYIPPTFRITYEAETHILISLLEECRSLDERRVYLEDNYPLMNYVETSILAAEYSKYRLKRAAVTVNLMREDYFDAAYSKIEINVPVMRSEDDGEDEDKDPEDVRYKWINHTIDTKYRDLIPVKLDKDTALDTIKEIISQYGRENIIPDPVKTNLLEYSAFIITLQQLSDAYVDRRTDEDKKKQELEMLKPKVYKIANKFNGGLGKITEEEVKLYNRAEELRDGLIKAEETKRAEDAKKSEAVKKEDAVKKIEQDKLIRDEAKRLKSMAADIVMISNHPKLLLFARDVLQNYGTNPVLNNLKLVKREITPFVHMLSLETNRLLRDNVLIDAGSHVIIPYEVASHLYIRQFSNPIVALMKYTSDVLGSLDFSQTYLTGSAMVYALSDEQHVDAYPNYILTGSPSDRYDVPILAFYNDGRVVTLRHTGDKYEPDRIRRIKPIFDIKLMVDSGVKDAEFDQIANKHYQVFKSRWPSCTIEREVIVGGYIYRITSTFIDIYNGFREVEIYRGTITDIIRQPFPMERAWYNGKVMMEASCLQVQMEGGVVTVPHLSPPKDINRFNLYSYMYTSSGYSNSNTTIRDLRNRTMDPITIHVTGGILIKQDDGKEILVDREQSIWPREWRELFEKGMTLAPPLADLDKIAAELDRPPVVVLPGAAYPRIPLPGLGGGGYAAPGGAAAALPGAVGGVLPGLPRLG